MLNVSIRKPENLRISKYSNVHFEDKDALESLLHRIISN